MGDLFRFTADASGIVAIDEDGAALTAATRDQTFRFNSTSWVAQAATFGEHNYDLDSVMKPRARYRYSLRYRRETTR